MYIPQPLIESYQRVEPYLHEVERRLTQSLHPFAQERLLPIISRVKTMESAAEKIETGRYRSFDDIDDLVACTIVIPNLSHEGGVTEFCQRVFHIEEVKRRASSKKQPELFRFDATRLYGFLIRPEGLDAGMGLSIFDVKFEIQVRTAFEHAWIVSMHPLTYKAATVDWRRFRLAAQIKATTEQLDLSIVQFEGLAAQIEESPWPELQQKRSVVEIVERLVKDGIIPTDATPKDMTRFADNVISLLKASKKKANVADALRSLEEGFRNLNAETFPRSISLLQVATGILRRAGQLSAPLQKYSSHVTDELKQLFPEVEDLTPIFAYDSQRQKL